MINISEVIETNKMIEQENLDVRTITMGINLLDCAAADVDVLCQNIYNKITRLAKNLVKTGEDISKEFGVPIVNKRISITPISLAQRTLLLGCLGCVLNNLTHQADSIHIDTRLG